MRVKKVRRLLDELPGVNNLGDKLIVDVKPLLTKVAKKRTANSRHVYAFTLLNQTFTKEAKAEIITTIAVHLDDKVDHLVVFDDNNEVFVTIFGVDFPTLDEIDIRIGVAIGFALGYCPEDVLLYIDDGAGQNGTTDDKNDVAGAKVLVEAGDIYEILLAEDERESVPLPVLAAAA